MAVSPRDSHEISPTIGGGTQVDDFTKGFVRAKHTKNMWELLYENLDLKGGVQGPGSGAPPVPPL